ncbi:CMP-N-acetylneuraminate-poly-alpha-2,8-sialyltransferase-like [Branchiostoma floridae x Branchiostoma belcheri]
MGRRRLCTVRRLLGLLLLTCTINITWIFLYLKDTAPISRDELNVSGRLLGNNVTETARPSTPDIQYLNMLNRLPIEPRDLRITGENNSVAKMIRDKIRNLLSPRQNMVLFSEFEANFERCNLSTLPDKHCFGTTPVKHHRTCAVVGSSGILLNSSCGNEIDSHDYVIRFNLVPLIKHARDAGMKSNLTVMNVYRLRIMVKRMELGSRRAWERFERINNSMIIYPKKLSRTAYQYRRYSELLELFRNRSRTATKKKRKVYLPLLYSITEVRNITTDFINEIYDYPGFHSPTIGLMTSFLALSFCDHVSLYGFYPLATDANNRTVKFHYHDDPLPGEGKILKPHIFNVEYDFMRNLNRVGVWDHRITNCTQQN